VKVPSDLKYTDTHVWIRIEGKTGTVGITGYEQKRVAWNIGSIVFIELPQVGLKTGRGDNIGHVESAMAIQELYAPVSGEVTKINPEIDPAEENNHDLVYEDSFGEGWLFQMRIADGADLSQLIDAKAYTELTKDLK
jgi:glycine cleavage system H protein